MYENQEEPTDTSYSMEDVAENFEAENFAYEPNHSADKLAKSLFTASQATGHNNKALRDAVGVAQQLVGNTENLTDNLRPFEVSDEAMVEANRYIQMLKETSKVCMSQAKTAKADNVGVFKDIDKLVNSVGIAEDYSKMVF